MKQAWGTWLLMAGIVTVLFGMAIHAPLIVIGETMFPNASEPIKAWKEFLILFLAVVAMVVVTRRRLWQVFLSDWVVRLSLAYVAVHLIFAVLIPTPIRETVAGLMIDLRYVAFLVITYVTARLVPKTRRNGLIAVAAGAAIVVGFGLLQISVLPKDVLAGIGYNASTIRPFTTIDENDDFIRINSTLRGPNPLGAMAVIYLGLLVAYGVARRDSLRRSLGVATASIVTTIVLFVSYSRSAYVAAAAMVVAVGSSRIKKFSPKLVGVTLVGLMLVIAVGMSIRSSDWFSNVILHEDPESTVVAKSNDGHVESLADGARRALVQPFGAGVGSTGSASLYEGDFGPTIENVYLFIAHESGWVGLGIFIALFVVVMKRLWTIRSDWAATGLFASGVGLAIIGMLLPVWMDESVALTWWGLVGCVVGMYARGIIKGSDGATPTK